MYLSSVVLISSDAESTVGVADAEDEVDEVVLVAKPEDSVDFGAAVELVLDIVEGVISDKFGLAAISVFCSSLSSSSLDVG